MLAIARRIVAIAASTSLPELRPLPTDDPQPAGYHACAPTARLATVRLVAND
ncbi:hypothetical protein [Paraburkholderia sp. RL17-337-BIB-A]|uniref:hypothetical protein n=1 Tax=Paraburkholderia sp. RL17-337-BIB-A TaxID=3031636 RepID=UPI0038B7B658